MSRCIDEVQKSLGFIGVSSQSITRVSNDEIYVLRKPVAGEEYELNIWHDRSDTIVFQSSIFRGVYGSAEKELSFYQALLYYNNYINFASFGITKLEQSNTWSIALTSNQLCSSINPKTLTQIIKTFDYAHLELVPHLKRKAQEWKLEFSGKIRNNIDKLLQDGQN